MLLDIKRIALSFFSISFVVLLVGMFASDSARAQAIHELKSSMNVAASGNVDVVEELKISFPAAKQRNQFYRVLPIWYQKQKNIHVVDINVKKVTMDDKAAVPLPHLTPRQVEVLRLLEQGHSTEQIAAELHLSKETVRNHIRRLFKALGVHSRLEAVAAARAASPY